jgi:hypothetical protein
VLSPLSAVVRVVVKPQIAISPFLKVKLGHFLKFEYKDLRHDGDTLLVPTFMAMFA